MPTVELSTGATIAYESVGSGPPVLCIQGTGVIGNGWRPQLDSLRDEFQLVSFDNRGIGRSSPAPDELTVDHMAADALALMDALELERPHVMGHSLGGVIALQLALSAPDRVRSLSLLCTPFRAKDAVAVTPGVIWRGIRTMVGTKRMRRAGFMLNVLPRDELRRRDLDELHDQLSPLFGRDLATTPPIVFRQVRAMQGHDLSPRLSELAHIPTLVVVGRHDVIVPPSDGHAMAAAIPGARCLEFEDAAHSLPILAAERTNACLREHLKAV